MGRDFFFFSVECAIRLIIPWQFLSFFITSSHSSSSVHVIPFVFMLQPLLKTHNEFEQWQQVILFKEVDGRVLRPWQKCSRVFFWVVWSCEGIFGSWKPNLAALLMGWSDENLVEAYCHCFHRAHLSWELRDFWHGSEMQIFPWGLGDLHCLLQCWSSRRSSLMMQVLISLGFVCLRLPGQEWELSSPVGPGYSYWQGNGVCSSMVDKSQGLQEAHYPRREDEQNPESCVFIEQMFLHEMLISIHFVMC